MNSNDERTLLINLISSHAANIGKALRMGRKFRAAGWDVVLFMNVDGVALLDPLLGQETCPVAMRPLASLLLDFLAEGGRGLAGAECMKLVGLGDECRPAGVEIAEFPLIEELLARPGIRIMTW